MVQQADLGSSAIKIQSIRSQCAETRLPLLKNVLKFRVFRHLQTSTILNGLKVFLWVILAGQIIIMCMNRKVPSIELLLFEILSLLYCDLESFAPLVHISI